MSHSKNNVVFDYDKLEELRRGRLLERGIRDRTVKHKKTEIEIVPQCDGCCETTINLHVCECCRRPQKTYKRRTAVHLDLWELLHADVDIVIMSTNPFERQVMLNARIIRKVGRSRRDMLSSRRHNIAIYRLYRYCNVPLWMLEDVAEIEQSRLQLIIGRVFSTLCLSDDSCIFKRFLQKVYSRHT